VVVPALQSYFLGREATAEPPASHEETQPT
jgi:hypothetical protein